MKMDVKVEGFKDLEKNLKKMSSNLDSSLDPAVHSAANMLKYEIGLGVPLGPTGNLRKSVIVRKMNNPNTHIAAIDRKVAPHAHLVEFGGRGGQMPANPFFRTAVDSGMPKAAKMIEEEVRKAFKKCVK